MLDGIICRSEWLILITYPEGDASVACWSNIGVLELGVLSGTVALAFKTAFNKQYKKKGGHAHNKTLEVETSKKT
jgi:hypothetical protein